MSTDTARGGELPLGDILAFHAHRTPDRPAVTQDGRTLSYAELDAAANRRARLLAAHGVGQDDRVVLALSNSIEFFETSFAVWKLGATPCPVSSKLPAAELAAIVETIAPRLVIGAAAGPRHIPANMESGGFAADALPPRVAPAWKAITSGGSTGRPKVVVAGTPGTADPTKGGYVLQRPGETILSPGPLYHNAAFSAAHQCLFAGGHVVSMERFDPSLALRLIERYRVGHMVVVPTMMARIWRLPEEERAAADLGSLNVVVHLGAPCPPWLKEAWLGWLGPDRLVEVYAGTEGIGATVITGREWLAHKGSVGRVAPGTEMKILGPDGDECAPGTIGEIYFRPPAARSFGYLGAEKQARGEWVSLGDLGWVDSDGYLYLADRRTDMIVSGGVNIYPTEVEAAIERHPDVRACVVIGLPDDDLGNRVHAIVQLDPAAEMTDDALRDFLGEWIVRYKIPRSFEFVTHDLRDDAGKARRLQYRDERVQAAHSSNAGALNDRRTA